MGLTKKLSDFNDRNNVWLKLLAVAISVLIWLVVVNVSDPVTTTTISGVPVEIINGDVLTSQGKYYELSSADTVTVTLSAKRSVLDSISKDNLRAVADMNSLNEESGKISLKVESNKYSEKIESMKAKEDSAVVNIDNLLKKQLAITTNVTGNPVENYVIGDVTMEQNIVRLSGPEKIVSKISKVVAELSVEGMSSNVSTSVELKLYDANGEIVDGRNVTKNINSVAIQADILATKKVPLKAYTSGAVAEDYGLNGEIVIEPAEVLIAGRNKALNRVSEIVIPSTDVSVEDAEKNVEVTLDLEDYLPDGIRFADSEQETEVKVVVGIDQKERETIEVTRSMINVTNMPKGYRGSISMDQPLKIEIIGMPKYMAALTETPMEVSLDVKAYMDNMGIDALAEATYEVPLTVKLPNGVTVVDNESFSVTFKVVEE